MEGYQWEGGKGTANKKHNWQVQNRQGEVKDSKGNGKAKELICTTHRHELRWEMMEAKGVPGRGGNGRKTGQLQQHNQ